MGPEAIAKGLENVVAASSQVTWVDGELNRLAYRGYDVADLARGSTYEEVAFLLWEGYLPTTLELSKTREKFRQERVVPGIVRRLIEDLPTTTRPLDALRTAVSALGSLEEGTPQPTREDRIRFAYHYTSVSPALVSDFWKSAHGGPSAHPGEGTHHAEHFLRLITRQEPTAEELRIFEAMMILHADHEMNTSTFAARVAASTRADMASALTAALATLSGPLHGGAGELVLEMVDRIGDSSHVDRFVQEARARHERFMGFGHRIYRGEDPRATVIREMARELSSRRKETTTFDILERLAQLLRKEKGLYPNVDLYSGTVYELLGIPRRLHSSVFAVSRMAGWTAHIMEEYLNQKLICPIARYEGPRNLTYPVTDTTRMRG